MLLEENVSFIDRLCLYRNIQITKQFFFVNQTIEKWLNVAKSLK